MLPAVGRNVERVAHDPFHAVPGVDRLLDRDLVRRPLPMETARSGVQPLGVLAHDDEVHVVLGVRRDQRLHARIADHRAEVDVLIQREADPKEQVALQDPGPDTRVAHRAEQYRVTPLDSLELFIRQDLPRPQVAVGAQIELHGFDLEAVTHALQDLERFGDHLGTRPVATDHSDPVGQDVPSSRGPSLACICRARLIAARYARALASTTSVATPRPVTRLPSTSSWTTTSPNASEPPVTLETLNATSRGSIPAARPSAPITASIMPSPMADSSIRSSPRRSRTVAVGARCVPPPT